MSGARLTAPGSMRTALSKGFAARGVPVRDFRYEEFEIRSGIGLRALAACLLDRMMRARNGHAGGADQGSASTQSGRE